MAKILVADDNSNIQKMVGLALKDHGIEVVAVGNGEAAVRKISDIHPDLVLADVFMPVRNGYEVCKYVKEDSALSHIPVILLVGAFDPLDEQEAQRAGADGVLKKPFVPPDPLISMVKSALVRAGVAHAGFTPPKPVAEVVPEPPPVEVPKSVAPPAPLPSFESESFVDEVPPPTAAVKFGAGQQPVAFGSLLGTEEEEAVTSVPAVDRDWRTEEVEEEEEEEEVSKAGWRRDAGNDEEAAEPAAREGGWRDAISDDQPVHAHSNARHHEPWSPTREKQDLSEAAEAEGEASGSPIPDFRNIPAAPFSGDAWAAAIEAGAGGQNRTAVVEAEHPAPVQAIQDSVATSAAPDLDTLVGHAEPEVERAVPVEEQSYVTEAPVAVAEPEVHAEEEQTSAPVEVSQTAAEPTSFVSEPVKSSTTSWFSTPPSPWDAEMQKASKLASTWDAPAPPPVVVPQAASTAPDEIEVVSGAVSAVIPEAVETAREEASHGASEVDMNSVVEKVMARMSPDKLHELTRDLLKPVIEGIVREEMNKKS